MRNASFAACVTRKYVGGACVGVDGAVEGDGERELEGRERSESERSGEDISGRYWMSFRRLHTRAELWKIGDTELRVYIHNGGGYLHPK